MAEERDNQVELPEGTTILEREPPQKDLELALDLAARGASETVVRAIGGEEAVEAMREAGLGAS